MREGAEAKAGSRRAFKFADGRELRFTVVGPAEKTGGRYVAVTDEATGSRAWISRNSPVLRRSTEVAE